MRCCPNDPTGTSSLYKLSWADQDNDGKVTIVDLASVAVCFGAPITGSISCPAAQARYWCNPNIACVNGRVGVVDLATVAISFGHGVTLPRVWAFPHSSPPPLTRIDPQIDPFFCPATGC